MTQHAFFNGAVRRVLPPAAPARDTFATHDEDDLRERWMQSMRPIKPAKPKSAEQLEANRAKWGSVNIRLADIVAAHLHGREDTRAGIAAACDISIDSVGQGLRVLRERGRLRKFKTTSKLTLYSLEPKK